MNVVGKQQQIYAQGLSQMDIATTETIYMEIRKASKICQGILVQLYGYIYKNPDDYPTNINNQFGLKLINFRK